MGTYGPTIQTNNGYDVQVAADGRPIEKAIGITLDWSTIVAQVAAITYDDGTSVAIGAKGLPFGTVLCKITTAEVQSVTLGGTPTGGTFTLSGNGRTSAPIAFNALAAAVQTAIQALGGDYAGAIVTGAAGGPYTVTFLADAALVNSLTGSAAALTSATTATLTIATPTPGIAGAGRYGPYDSAATDGRQTLTRGRCAILNRTVLEMSFAGLGGAATDHPQVLTGGRMWRARLRIGAAPQPTVPLFEAAFPLVEYVDY